MCRSTDIRGYSDRDRLKIKSFFVKFSGLDSQKTIPESVTLLYRPRINDTELEVDGSKIRPDSAAFVTLHRVAAAAVQTAEGEVVFGSRERVKVASGGVQFVVYFEEEKVLKGVFRSDEDEEWKLECECVLEREVVGGDVAVADVFVGVEGHVAMCERVVMRRRRRKGRKNRRRVVGFDRLEEIPEEREVDMESDGGCCCCDDDGSNGGDVEKGCDELEKEMEGVRWAVDLGIWVMCFGVGYFVSKASSKNLRRLMLL